MVEKIQEFSSNVSEEYKQSLREQMIQGYKEMAEINLHIANEFSHAESDAMETTESFLK